jgi:hypothetical protein
MMRFKVGQRWVPRMSDGRYAIVIGVRRRPGGDPSGLDGQKGAVGEAKL